MSELNLTLLTDEELVNSFQTVSIQAHSATNDRFVAKFHAIRNELLGRLIAARAENKRKDEALRLALPVLEYIKSDGWDEAPPLGWPHDEHLALEKVRAALLQSEKGGE